MKTTLDLLDRPFIFSQQGPLSPDDFIKEAKRRGVALEIAHLDTLHRAGILVPIYRVARDLRAVRAELASGSRLILPQEAKAAQVITLGPFLQQDRDSGRLADPRGERARPWRSYRHSFGSINFPTEEGTTEHQFALDASVFL